MSFIKRISRAVVHRVRKYSYNLLPETGPFRVILRRRRQKKFEKIMLSNTWGCAESVSGPGSTLAATAKLREELPKLIKELKVSVLFDAPCGDFNWFSRIALSPELSYIGGDIVEPLVKSNQNRYGSTQRRFITFDIVHDPLPDADLWLCRDCLFHFPFKDIKTVLGRFAGSRIPFLLTTLHPEHPSNMDIAPGEYRFLNLCLPPFNLPKPLLMIEELPDDGTRQCLGLWQRSQFKDWAC